MKLTISLLTFFLGGVFFFVPTVNATAPYLKKITLSRQVRFNLAVKVNNMFGLKGMSRLNSQKISDNANYLVGKNRVTFHGRHRHPKYPQDGTFSVNQAYENGAEIRHLPEKTRLIYGQDISTQKYKGIRQQIAQKMNLLNLKGFTAEHIRGTFLSILRPNMLGYTNDNKVQFNAQNGSQCISGRCSVSAVMRPNMLYKIDTFEINNK